MTPASDSGKRPWSSSGLHRSDDGIWRPEDDSAPAVSFPRGGHQECFDLEPTSFWFGHRNRCIVAMARRFPPPGPIFDVGGGTGFVSLALREAGFATVLVEPEPAGARLAHQRGLDPVVCATLESAGFEGGSLSGIGMFDVIEHVADDLALLRTARSLLRPDGRLYVTVPAHRWLWSFEDEVAGHYRRYTTWSLGERLRTCGFRADFMSYLFWPLPPVIFIGRRIGGLLGSRRSDDPNKYRRQHEGSRIAARAVARLLDLELRLLDRRRRIPLGSSCIAVASPSEAT